MRYFFAIVLFFSSLQYSFAQQELSTHFMRSAWQSNQTNPALIPTHDYRFIVSLPNLYYNFHHSASSYNDLLKSNNGNTILDFGNLIDGLEDENNLQTHLDIETLSIAFKLGRLNLSLGHAIRSSLRIDYNKNLPELLWYGNAPYIGETVSFGPSVQALSYNEFALGAAFKLSKITLGAKAKYLNGIGVIQTDEQEASLYTDDDIYQLTFNTNYRINTSSFLTINSLEDFTFNPNITDNLFSSNSGFAIDLGIHFKVNDQLDLAASVRDIGQIDWKNNTTSYHSQGSYTYDGINLNQFINNDEIDFDVKLDTLREVFNFNESRTSFNTTLPLKTYLSANYQLNELLSLSGLYYLEHFDSQNNHAIAISARASILQMLTLGAVYSVRNNDFFNLGLNLECKLGPVQLVAMTDNILDVFTLYDSRNVNGRVGLNLIF